MILTQFLCQIPDCTCFNQFEINFLELSLGSVNRTLLSQDVVSGVNLEGTARTYQQLPYTLCISPIYTFVTRAMLREESLFVAPAYF